MGDDDAEILYPADDPIEINGELITVRELTYGQSMRLSAALEPLLQAMARALQSAEHADELQMIMAQHPESWAALICAATGRDRDWLDTLTDEQGMAIQARAWSRNSAFFARRLITGAAISRAVDLAARAQAEASPTQPSP